MNHATVRFYEELNDFLPEWQRKRDLVVSWLGTTRVKDLLGPFGVPQSEVDLLLINSKPSGWDDPVHDGDRISVYPVFEHFDISGLSPRTPLRHPRFIIDAPGERLVRLMRAMGFDAVSGSDDHTILARAAREHRIILTLNPRLLMHEGVTHGILLREETAEEQAQEIVQRLQLETLVKPFTRCVDCNGHVVAASCESCGKDAHAD